LLRLSPDHCSHPIPKKLGFQMETTLLT